MPLDNKMRMITKALNIKALADDLRFKCKENSMQSNFLKAYSDGINKLINDFELPGANSNWLGATNLSLFHFLPIIGDIFNSSKADYSKELYYHIDSFAKKYSLNENINVYINADFNYTPTIKYKFTPNADSLGDYIILSLSSSEANYFTTIPIIAHEIGHYIWRKHYRGIFNEHFEQIKFDDLENFFARIILLNNNTQNSDMNDNTTIFGSIVETAQENSIRMLEEVFCDMIGVFTFRESYLDAFLYILAPRLGKGGSTEYPSIYDRALLIQKAAQKIGIDCNNFVGEFIKDEESENAVIKTTRDISDFITHRNFEFIFNLAKSHINKLEVIKLTSNDLKLMTDNIYNCSPISCDSIEILTNLFWSALNNLNNWPSFHNDYTILEKFDIINNLFYKSCECSEITHKLSR